MPKIDEIGDLDLFDFCAARHRDNPQSVEAHTAIVPTKRLQRRRIFDLIRARGDHGATLDEICQAWNVPPNAISGRITDLKKLNKIVQRNGEDRRITRSGCSAAVYVVATCATAADL